MLPTERDTRNIRKNKKEAHKMGFPPLGPGHRQTEFNVANAPADTGKVNPLWK